LNAAQWMLTVVALVLGFRGSCQHGWCVLLFVALPVTRFLLAPGYRRQTLDHVGRLWQACQHYPIGSMSIPWRAIFCLVVLPAVLLLLGNNCFGAGDNLPVMLVASSLVTEGNWDVDEFLGRPDFVALGGFDGRPLHSCLLATATG